MITLIAKFSKPDDRLNPFGQISQLRPKHFFFLAICISALALFAPASQAQDELTKEEAQVALKLEKAQKLIERYGQGPLELTWKGSLALEDLGEEVIPVLQEQLESENPFTQIMVIKVLISLSESHRLDRKLRAILENKEAPTDLRAAAIGLLAQFPDKKNEKAIAELLRGDDNYDAKIRIAAGRCLYALSRKQQGTARKALLPLLKVDDLAVQTQAALSLGEMGYTRNRVKLILNSLADQPTPNGARARLILRNERLMRKFEDMLDEEDSQDASVLNLQIERLENDLKKANRIRKELQARLEKSLEDDAGTAESNPPLIKHLIQQIKNRYADTDRLSDRELLVEAAKGLVGSLDPFSSFMDPKDQEAFAEGMSGEYAGIGVQISKDAATGTLLILRLIYNGPSYRAGLLTNDRILQIDGQPTLGLSMEEVRNVLGGKADTIVHLKVIRRGWKSSREFVLKRQVIKLDSVQSTMLPAKIGYLRLSQFGNTAITEFEEHLSRLEKEGLKGLIFDLRNNPGGYLSAACRIVDSFVSKQEQPIVTQRDASNRTPSQVKLTTDYKRGDYPIVILVNKSSASASEIVSGALQDYQRATVIGEQSYGKGSVQNLIALPKEFNETLGGEAKLRLTVQYYYLPSGRSIHSKRNKHGVVTEAGGVIPDQKVLAEEIPLWRINAINGLIEDKAFDAYLDKHFESNREQLTKIALEGDSHKSLVYPGFNEFSEAHNKTNAHEDDIRYYLRQRIRRKLEDERGKQFACDFAEDVQLQRAILKLLEEFNMPLADLPSFSAIRDSIREDGSLIGEKKLED